MCQSRLLFAEENALTPDPSPTSGRGEAGKGLALAKRVHPKYRPVFEKMNATDRAAAALYFLPHGSKKDLLEVTRPKVIKWYCPFADQQEFPSWRLPENVANEQIVGPFLELCERYSMSAKACKANLIGTP